MIDTTKGTHCADCGAEFPKPPASGGASGYGITKTARFPYARVRVLHPETLASMGTGPDNNVKGGHYWPAQYDVEHAQPETAERRICYSCCAALEIEYMQATGRTCLYLSEVDSSENPAAPRTHSRRCGPHNGNVRHYYYTLAGWPGNPAFPIIGRVRESYGYGFGRRYDVRTFRFRGPDGFVWSGRNAGDMQLARCKRTKDRL